MFGICYQNDIIIDILRTNVDKRPVLKKQLKSIRPKCTHPLTIRLGGDVNAVNISLEQQVLTLL